MIGHVEQGGQRREPDQLGLVQMNAILGGLGPDGSPRPARPAWSGSRAGSSTPAPGRVPRSRSPLAWTRGRPPLDFADPPRDPLGELHVPALEVDVVGDQERPGADGHRTGAGVERGRARSRAPAPGSPI